MSEQQTKEKAQQLTKREFTAKFGKSPRVCIPSECAFDFFQLNEKLGHKCHGDTVAWLLLKQAELAVQDTNINEEDVKNEEIERKDLEQVWEKYEVNQVWALWDDGVDGMPRVYVRIEKLLLEELKVEVVFLEANAGRDEEKKWLREKELPMACGRFKVGTSTSIVEILDFSYPVNLERGELSKMSKLYVAKGESWVNIFPRDGEIWAVYKDWSANWTLHDLSRARYELVEVVSELPSSESDMTVICLTRVEKTRVEKSGVVFERGYHKGEIMWRQYTGKQLLQFSHRIPASKLKIEELKGVPNEAWKLNPAAVPLHLL
ncbi:hypothetical protein ACHQM5_021870 [Ranunculus cassubicifolius]